MAGQRLNYRHYIFNYLRQFVGLPGCSEGESR